MDYKDGMQMRAEELAEEEYGTDFYSLTPEQQMDVYERGSRAWVDDQVDLADRRRKSELEGR